MSKKVKKIIPKEIRPALPAIAAIAGPQFLAGGNFGVLTKLATSNPHLTAALLSGATQGITEGKIDPKQTALAGIQSYAGGKLTALGKGADPGTFKAFLGKTGQVLKPDLSKGFTFENVKAVGKAAIPETSYAVSQDIKEMNEKALRDYEAQLAEQGILDKADRRNKIFGYFTNAGYDTGEVNSFLDKYGYADGGRVGYKNGTNPFLEARAMRGRGIPMTESGRKVLTMEDLIKGAIPNEDDENYEDDGFKIYPKGTTSKGDLAEGVFGKSDSVEIDDKSLTEKKLVKLLKEATGEDDESRTYKRLGRLQEGLEGIMSGFQLATGTPLMGAKPQPTRFGLAEGGIPLTQPARKTLRELIEAGMLEDEGEGIMDIIKQNPGAIGGPIMPMKPSEPKSQTAPIQMMASSDRYTELVEQFMYEGYDYDTASEMAFKALQEDDGYAKGGMINTGGREMDMRGGGFIPIGAKERADDVPARLSKNEFVMTADAVRGAGNGSINKGAKRMYDLMNKLESKV